MAEGSLTSLDSMGSISLTQQQLNLVVANLFWLMSHGLINYFDNLQPQMKIVSKIIPE